MSPSLKATHEIRYLDEIKSLFAIDFEGLLTKETYSHPPRSYHLIRSEARCQFLKKGSRCGQEHSHGFAVACKAGQHFLIGKCCAFNHLGIDDDKVKNTFRELSSAERMSIRSHKISEMLGQRSELIARIKGALKQLRSLQLDVYKIQDAFPPSVIENLVERWRRDSLHVTWEYQITKKDENAKGKDAIERRWYPHICGFIKGLGIWLDLDSQKYQEKLYAFLHKVQAVGAGAELTQLPRYH